MAIAAIRSRLSIKYCCSLHKKTVLLLLIQLIAVYNHAQAEDAVADKFKIAIGGYTLSSYKSTMSLTDVNIGAGVSISPEDTLGLKTKQVVLRVDGYYRFNKQDALTYSWYSISSEGNKSIEEQIDWIDENGDPITIPLGSNVTSILEYDIFKIGYLRSFYHSDKVELAAGAGLHITSVAIGIRASTTSTGIEAQDVSTTLPLPVLSFGLTYHVTPKLKWYLKSEFFAMSFNNWQGTYTDSALGIEYRAFDHIGLGAGIGSNALKLIEDRNDTRFDFDNRISGAFVYVAAYF